MATLLMPREKNLNLASNINTFFSTLPTFTKITYVANLMHFNMFSSFTHSEIEKIKIKIKLSMTFPYFLLTKCRDLKTIENDTSPMGLHLNSSFAQ